MCELPPAYVPLRSGGFHGNKTSEITGIVNPEVLIASQMLDEVLNEYYRLMIKKKNGDA